MHAFKIGGIHTTQRRVCCVSGQRLSSGMADLQWKTSILTNTVAAHGMEFSAIEHAQPLPTVRGLWGALDDTMKFTFRLRVFEN